MFKNKSLSRLLSLIAAFSVLFTAFAGISASAEVTSVANQSFYEDFEGYSNASYTQYNGRLYYDWEMRNSRGSAVNVTEMNLSTVAGGFEGSKALKVGRTVSAAVTTTINTDPNIMIGKEDIIISGDVYIPAINTADSDQRVRFYVSRGQDTSAAAADGWKEFNPRIVPAFGLYFTGNGTNWIVRIGTSTKTNDDVNVGTVGINNYTVVADKWYNICYVYHPTTGEVDYYIDGEFVTSHPINTKVGTTDDTYIIPTLVPGKKLGNINIAVGGLTNENAAQFDNISVTTASSADSAKYTDVAPGTEYVFANWDIPVDKTTANNVTVKKMATNDITFSGIGATDADCTVQYKGSNGVGIKFNAPLATPYERYQVKATGVKDVYGKTVDRVYNFAVKDAIKFIEESNSDYLSNTTNWTTNASNLMTVSSEADAERGTVLKAVSSGDYPQVYNSISTANFNIDVNNTVKYVEAVFDLKAEIHDAEANKDSKTGIARNYTAYVMLGSNSANPQRVTGISIWTNEIRLVTQDGKDAGTGYRVTSTQNSAVGATSGVWKSYKMRYYPYDGKMEVFVGDTQETLSAEPVLSGITLKSDKATQLIWDSATCSNEIRRFSIQTINAGTTTYLDNLKVSSYGYYAPTSGTTVKTATFEDANGKMLDDKSGAKTVKVYMDKATAAPTVALNGSSVSGAFDAATGIYTVTLSDMLVGSTSYTLTVNGTDYTFTTGAGEFKASNLRFEKGGVEVKTFTTDDVLTAKVDVYNSKGVNETPYLVWAAYNGDVLETVDFCEITAASGKSETKSADDTLTITGDYTAVKAFLWDGLSTLVPLVDSITIEKN